MAEDWERGLLNVKAIRKSISVKKWKQLQYLIYKHPNSF